MIAGLLTTLGLLAMALGAGPRRARVPPRSGSWPSIEQPFSRLVIAADLPLSVPRPLVIWLAAAIVAGAVGFVLGSAPMTVSLLGAIAVVPPVALIIRGDRSGAMLVRQLPAFVDGVGRQLRVGRSLRQAIDELRRTATHPLDRDLDAVAAQCAQGRSMVEALHHWAQVRGEPDVHLVVTALAVGHATGGQRTAALEGVARSLRDRQAVAAELEALTAQARTSGLVVALAPPAFTLILVVSGIAPPLSWERPAIAIAGSVGLALDIGGLLWMRRLTRPRW